MHSVFDSRAAGWDTPARLDLARNLYTALRRQLQLPDGARVLDYGAGTGLATLAFLADGCRVCALDTSAGMQAELARKLAALPADVAARAGLRLLTSPDDALPAGPFDLVHLAMTLHHVADAAGLLARLGHSLAPGGQIAVFDLEPDEGRFHPGATGVFHDGFEPATLQAWLQAAGFTGIVIKRVHEIDREQADGTSRRFGILGAFAHHPGPAGDASA